MKYIFAGDRQISCQILKFLISNGFYPEALLVTDGPTSSNATDLVEISGLNNEFIIYGKEFKSDAVIDKLKSLEVDYIFGIHYPYIIPKVILDIPKIGFTNLHPAFLPFNKGWHTPSWAILQGTPYGATLHFMSEELDKGDIIHQELLTVEVDDTANSLYQKALELEYQIFVESFEKLKSLLPNRIKQVGEGTSHTKKDLARTQKLELDETGTLRSFLDKLRALTTNNPEELSYFFENDRKIGVKIEFVNLEK